MYKNSHIITVTERHYKKKSKQCDEQMLARYDSFTSGIQNDRLRRVDNDGGARNFIPYVKILEFVYRRVNSSVKFSKVYAVGR